MHKLQHQRETTESSTNKKNTYPTADVVLMQRPVKVAQKMIKNAHTFKKLRHNPKKT